MWVWDAPSGVFRDHTLSSRIREAAIADAQFMRFARPETGFGKGKVNPSPSRACSRCPWQPG